MQLRGIQPFQPLDAFALGCCHALGDRRGVAPRQLHVGQQRADLAHHRRQFRLDVDGFAEIISGRLEAACLEVVNHLAPPGEIQRGAGVLTGDSPEHGAVCAVFIFVSRVHAELRGRHMDGGEVSAALVVAGGVFVGHDYSASWIDSQTLLR
jgi:hypothetical protein